jgi:rod shape-determining protein MreB
MFSRVFGFVSSDMAIDLGTANTLVYVPGRGIVLEEPSVVAIAHRERAREVIAVGREAKAMLGRTPDSIETVQPMRDGVIADFTAAEEMIKQFVRRVHRRRLFTSPRILICVPASATPVERRAVHEAALAFERDRSEVQGGRGSLTLRGAGGRHGAGATGFHGRSLDQAMRWTQVATGCR